MTHTPPARSGSDSVSGEQPEKKDLEKEQLAESARTGAPDEADRIASLRGASVEFDRHRAVQVVVGVLATTFVVLIVVFTVSGIHSNNQIDTLHDQGVPVTVTVTSCLGLLGGSGSNAAGYSCHGTYVVHGHRYTESLPGTSFHRPGSTIASVAVPGDPALVSPDSVIDNEHSSAGVFVLPAVLTVALVALLGVVVWRRRAARRADTNDGHAAAGDAAAGGGYVGGV